MAGMATIATDPDRTDPDRIVWPAASAGEWTVDMLRDLPDDGRRYEIIDGVLLVTPAPVPRHQLTAANLYDLLRGSCPDGYRVFFAPLDWQPDNTTSLEPDLLIIPRSAYRETETIGTPVVAIEIASPSTARIDRTVKKDRYEQGGIVQYWLVDPGAGGKREPHVEVFNLAEGSYQLLGRADGAESITVTLPWGDGSGSEITLCPADLIAW